MSLIVTVTPWQFDLFCIAKCTNDLALAVSRFRADVSVSESFVYHWYLLHSNCCNLSVCVALIVSFTTNGVCAKNTTYMWREQAIVG